MCDVRSSVVSCVALVSDCWDEGLRWPKKVEPGSASGVGQVCRKSHSWLLWQPTAGWQEVSLETNGRHCVFAAASSLVWTQPQSCKVLFSSAGNTTSRRNSVIGHHSLIFTLWINLCFYNFMSRSLPKKPSKVRAMLSANHLCGLNSLGQPHSWASKTSEPLSLPHTYTPVKKVDDTQREYKGKSNGWSKSDEGKRQNPGCRRLNGKKEGRREKGKRGVGTSSTSLPSIYHRW